MLKKFHLLAALLAVPSLAACGQLPAASLAAKTAAPVASAPSFGAGSVVTDTHLGGNRFASFTVSALAPTYAAQSVVHRWTQSDIAYYVLTIDDVTQGASGDGVAHVQVNPGQSAVFTNMAVNTLYRVTVTAYSDVQSDGTTGVSAQQIDTMDTGNSAEFSFTNGGTNNNIDNQINYCSSNFYNSLFVHLDNVAFSGTATIGTSGASFSVYDGGYTAPTQPISATAVDGSNCNCSGDGSAATQSDGSSGGNDKSNSGEDTNNKGTDSNPDKGH
ncbi:MAG: hypothetical protein KGR26_01575 [Cyanobacteria bacterium REEB65]|nr:hypothetical protein [Cyanobacteria bacterium REEB65]